MSGNTYGKLYKITTFGESHGKAIGCVIDGCPSNLDLNENDIQKYLDRRKPNFSNVSTKRKESDKVKILSGVLDGKTLGTPICAIVENEDMDDSQYDLYKKIYRPGHADYTYDKKYGINDYRNGGRASGRETIGRVIGGAVAIKLLNKYGITIETTSKKDLSKIGVSEDDVKKINVDDSVGGNIICIVNGCPIGLGEPVFDKLDAELAKVLMSIGAVKGVEVGAGFAVASMKGSECNDRILKNGKTYTNNAGGIVGGISNGNDIIINLAIKPTPTIAKKQMTINKNNEEVEIELGGRNDVCIVDRMCVVVEAMVAITIFDNYLQKNAYNGII